MIESMVSLAQQPDGYFDAAPTLSEAPDYAPQSGQIFGILKQMKEDFETNLGNSQKEEVSNVKAYEDLKSAKSAQIQAAQEQIDTKSKEAAAADEKKATSKEDLEETQANLA